MNSIEAMKLAIDAARNDDFERVINLLEKAIAEAKTKPDYEKAYLAWQDKTEWVQETAQPHELGMHRADVLKQRIDELKVKAEKQEPVVRAMTAERALYFMERFKHEEKLLGPNEQAAVNFVISMLEAPPQRQPLTDEIPQGVLLAISNAGLTLLKTQHGYQLQKLGPVYAHGIKGEA